jgi:hypothetical protein
MLPPLMRCSAVVGAPELRGSPTDPDSRSRSVSDTSANTVAIDLVAFCKLRRPVDSRVWNDANQVIFQHPGERCAGAMMVDAGGKKEGVEIGDGTGRSGPREGLVQQA